MIQQGILKLAGDPARIKRLSISQMELLAGEIREELLNTVSQTGGHLASNLGVVELTIALLYCFSPPDDKIVWDVGHQSYTYKLLTGRKDRFSTLRQKEGLSGFPKSAESEYDAFLGGHASTSIAAAFGLERAMALRGDDHHAIAVIGDGALTGGLAYEGINNAGKSAKNLIVVLNDNEMAISKNEGAIAKHLSVIRSRPGYFHAKRVTETALRGIPLVGERLRDIAAGSKAAIKQIFYPSSVFEELGFAYLGPVDGHNLRSLCDVLTQAKAMGCPVLLHIQTQKGRGYLPAQKNPGLFHGISSFDLATGRPKSSSAVSFSSVFGETLLAEAERDPRICAVTAAMEDGCGLTGFARRFKSAGRYFDVGIAEGFGVTFSAALAAGGMLPVFAVYSTFLQRGYDMLLHDCAIERRHVVFGIDRAGVVGDDGETHQGIFDVAFLSTVFGAAVWAPANYSELRSMLRYALRQETGPAAVRYPRGSEDALLTDWKASGAEYDVIPGKKSAIVTYGRTFAAARQAAQETGAAVIKLNRILPIPIEAVKAALPFERILFAEEGCAKGGLGEQYLAALARLGFRGEAALRAIDGFVPQSTVQDALHRLGLDVEGIRGWIDQAG